MYLSFSQIQLPNNEEMFLLKLFILTNMVLSACFTYSNT